MNVTVDTIREARERISPYIFRTPVLRIPSLDRPLGCRVFVKAECMQITGAFKLRGAMNKLLSLTDEQRSHGVVAASSGNHGRALAYGAKMLGINASVVMPRTASPLKIENVRALGANVVLCDVSERFRIAEELCAQTGAVMIPPYNDEEILAGQGTAGLEIAEQCPALEPLIVPVSGGGLLGGVATAVRAMLPDARILGAEPSAVPRYSASLAAGQPVRVTRNPSAADALVSDLPGAGCFPYVRENVNGVCAVDDEFMLEGMRLLLTEGRILAEPSSAIGIGAVLQSLISVRPEENVCFLISGGNVAAETVSKILNS